MSVITKQPNVFATLPDTSVENTRTCSHVTRPLQLSQASTQRANAEQQATAARLGVANGSVQQ